MTAARRLAALAAAALSIVAIGGCAADPVPAGSPVATATVDLPPSYRFTPVAITVPAGTTVTWTNHDNFTHSVQLIDGGPPADPGS